MKIGGQLLLCESEERGRDITAADAASAASLALKVWFIGFHLISLLLNSLTFLPPKFSSLSIRLSLAYANRSLCFSVSLADP